MPARDFLKGRPVSLHVLDYGLFKVHANDRVIGICGFLIQTDAGETVLVDTGFPRKYAEDKDAATKEDRLYEFGEVLECEMANMPAHQIGLAGIKPDQIDLHIVTHLRMLTALLGGMIPCLNTETFRLSRFINFSILIY